MSEWVCVCVVGGLNQWTERDIFVRGVGVNESVKAFFSLCRPRLSVSLLVAINPMRASEPEGRMGRANAMCGGCVERGPNVFCSPPGARPSEIIWTLPCPTYNVESVSQRIRFVSMQFKVSVHVWNDGPRSQSGWGTLQRLLQSYQHHPDPSVLTSAALSKTHTHTHTHIGCSGLSLKRRGTRRERAR